jgi:hypothetical protein
MEEATNELEIQMGQSVHTVYAGLCPPVSLTTAISASLTVLSNDPDVTSLESAENATDLTSEPCKLAQWIIEEIVLLFESARNISKRYELITDQQDWWYSRRGT